MHAVANSTYGGVCKTLVGNFFCFFLGHPTNWWPKRKRICSKSSCSKKHENNNLLMTCYGAWGFLKVSASLTTLKEDFCKCNNR